MPDQTTAEAIARSAAALVSGDRQSTHGDKVSNHASIASVWNGYLEARRVNGKPDSLGAEDVANMMELMKVARRLTGAFNLDDYVDGCGYSACAGEIRARAEGVAPTTAA